MINKAARDYGSSRIIVAQRFIAAYRKRFSPIEIAEYDLLNTSSKDTAQFDNVSNEELLDFQKQINPASHIAETEDKLAFTEKCLLNDLPTTTRVGVLILRPRTDKNRHQIALRDAAELVGRMQAREYVLKPVEGCHGKGVLTFTHPASDGQERTEALIANHCIAHTNFSRWLVEERLFNHDEMLLLSPAKALQTLRVVTFVDREGQPCIIAAQWRLANTKAFVDNFCYGTNSGLLCEVDMDTGEIKVAYKGKNYPFEFGLDLTDKHMETGKLLVGERLPLWEDVVQLVKRAALAFLPTRTIGWDVAITETGPVLIEGNRFWDAHNEGGGMRELLVWMQERA